MGRPGRLASSRASASAREGTRKRRSANTKVPRNAIPRTANTAQSRSPLRLSCAPIISSASSASTSVSIGQSACTSASASIPAQVSRNGLRNTRSPSALSVDVSMRHAPVARRRDAVKAIQGWYRGLSFRQSLAVGG